MWISSWIFGSRLDEAGLTLGKAEHVEKFLTELSKVFSERVLVV